MKPKKKARTQILKSKSDHVKSTFSNPKSFKLQTSIHEKPSGERDPWLHEDRSGRGGAENSGGESRAEQSIREERENFRKNEEKWCLVTRIVELGIANRG